MNKKGDEEMSETMKGLITVLLIVVCAGGIAWLFFKGGNAINFVRHILGAA